MKFVIHSFDTLISSNDTAADTSYGDGDVIVAEFQSAGRGQRGNHWESTRGENLTFSIVIEPRELQIFEHFQISMTAALSIAHTLSILGVDGVEVKWPNDILIKGRKVAGILIENSITNQYISRSVIGIGINLLQERFSPSALNPTSLALQGVVGIDRMAVLRTILEKFNEVKQLTITELHCQYMEKLYRGDGYYKYRDVKSGEVFLATIDRINMCSGELTLLTSDNQPHCYFFKEVEFL